MIKIYFATIKDLENICALEKEWKMEKISPNMLLTTKKVLQKIINDNNVFVAKDNNKIIGYLLFKLHKTNCNLDAIYIQKGYRKKSVGTKLMKHFLSLGKIKKCKTLFLHADSIKENKLISFYNKFGFKKIAIVLKKQQ